MRAEYIIIIIVCLVIAIAIVRSKRKDFKLEANKLVMLLGGKDNVIDYQVNKSLFEIKVNCMIPKRKLGFAIKNDTYPSFTTKKFIELLKENIN